MLKGQCLHALYVSNVHVSDQHQNKYKYSRFTLWCRGLRMDVKTLVHWNIAQMSAAEQVGPNL